jgi:hypothetical protein
MIVIAMTREIGSHGELGLTVINSEIVASNVAGRIGVEEGTVHRYLEGSASIFERWQIDKRKLSRYTSEELLTLAQQGNVLIRGWGAAEFPPAEGATRPFVQKLGRSGQPAGPGATAASRHGGIPKI